MQKTVHYSPFQLAQHWTTLVNSTTRIYVIALKCNKAWISYKANGSKNKANTFFTRKSKRTSQHKTKKWTTRVEADKHMTKVKKGIKIS
jgi:hypothetical protein